MTVIVRSKVTDNLVDSYEGSTEGAEMFVEHIKDKYRPQEINIIKF